MLAMRIVGLTSLVLLGACVGPDYVRQPTAAQVADATSPTALAEANAKITDPEDRIVCMRQHVVGSNRPQKVCMTKRQQREMRDMAGDFYKNAENRPSGDRPGSGL